MDTQLIDSTETATLSPRAYRVLAMLKRPGSGDSTFTTAQLQQLLLSGRIDIGAFDSGYSYTSALNHLRSGRTRGGHQSGKKSLSLMLWDLLESGSLTDKPKLRAEAKALHARTGGFIREAKVSNPMVGWVLENKDILAGTVRFSTDIASLTNLGASSKQEIEIVYSCCGSTVTTSCTKFTEKVKSHKKYGTPVKCADCSKSYIPLRDLIAEYGQLLEDSGAVFDRVSAEQLELPSGSAEEIEVLLACHGEYVTLSAESLKSKIKLAVKKSHSQITCNDCSVTQGKIEGRIISFIRGNIATTDFLGLPSATLKTQFRIPSIVNMPFDLMVISADGVKTIIEVDGGYHYEHLDAEAFKKRVANDRLKTETALREGYNLIRIDERKLIVPTGEIESMLLQATIGAVSRYTVMGAECPGAALVSEELKG